MDMNIIKNNTTNELIIKKSKFITYLYYVDNIDIINIYLNEIRLKYKDCTHICYAYIYDNKKKYNDDNEPGGTAGLPILNILEKNNLSNVLAIVVRYFGGIKLGANGLIRAYSNSIKECLIQAGTTEYIKIYKIKLTTSHNNLKLLNTITNNYKIINKTFSNDIGYTIIIEEKDKDTLFKELDEINEIKKEII